MSGPKGSMVEETLFLVIRDDNGHEWPDLSTISWSKKGAREKAEQRNKQVPQWGNANPVVRIGQFEVKEVMR